jgi:uncharacterized protein (DUF433 family)/DNA-binding transcriptional MerR regulator
LRQLPFGLDAGIYLQSEAAHLTGLTATTVRRWLQLERGAKHISAVAQQPLVSFHDLVSLRAVAALRRLGLPLSKIRKGVDVMRQELGIEHPLASEILRTDGVELYFSDAHGLIVDTVDGQMAAQELLATYLRDVKYEPLAGDHRLAVSWDPPGVRIDPLIQRGAPCVGGSRVEITLLKRYIDAGDSLEYLAELYELDVDDVRRAVAWYGSLKPAA